MSPAQVEACAGKADDAPCQFSGSIDGACHDEVCIPRACGNGVREASAGEDCDGTDIGDATCTQQGYYRGTIGCSPSCRFDLTNCSGTCGDGVADTANGEACDKADLGGATCATGNFYGGTLACLPSCQFNYIGCKGLCGDGAKDASEMCDGSDFGADACTDHFFAAGRPFYGGHLTCNATCDGVTTGSCTGYCGDGVANGPEACDTTDLSGIQCRNLGYYVTGSSGPACSADCTTATQGTCSGYCGDSSVNGPEICDGASQGNVGCTSFLASAGALGCDGFCQRTQDGCLFTDIWQSVASPAPSSSAILDMFALGEEEVWFVGDSLLMRSNGQRFTSFDVSPRQFYSVWAHASNDVWAVGNSGEMAHYDGATVAFSNLGSAHLNAVWGLAANDVWAAGAGSIYHYDGSTWTLKSTVSGVTISDIWGGATNDVWFGGVKQVGATQTAQLIHWTGSSFTTLTTPDSPWIQALWGSATNDVWALGSGSGSFAYVGHWNGAAWSTVTTTIANSAQDIQGLAADDIWIATGGAAYHYDGTSWTAIGTIQGTTAVSIAPTTPTDVWVGGTGGTLLRWRGTGWTTYDSNTSQQMYNVFGLSSKDVWAVGQSGAVSHWDGAAWTPSTVAGVTGVLYGAWGASSNDVWAVGGFTSGLITHWTGSANGWSAPISTTKTLYAISGIDATHMWAVGQDGTILFGNGSTWVPQTSNTTKYLWGVYALSANDVWAVGDPDTNAGSAAVHWNGSTWTPSSTGFSGLRSVWGASSSDVWASTNNQLFHWDGAFWGTVSLPSSNGMNGLWGFGTDDVYTTSNILHWDGSSWSDVIEPPEAETAIWGASRDDLWMTGQSGKLYHWGGNIARNPAGACARPAPLYCGTTIEGSNSNGGHQASYACASARMDTGAEASYRFASPVNGSVTITMTPHNGDLDLIALGGKSDGTCAPTSCLAVSQNTGTDLAGMETITLPVIQGQELHVVVDGFAGASGGYSLHVQCTKN